MRELNKHEKTSNLPSCYCHNKMTDCDLCNTLNDQHTDSVKASMQSCETMLSPLAMTHWKLQ